MELEGKAALITGGGTGVGRATALALAERGCAVAVNYSRSEREAEQTVAELQAKGVRALAVRADVADDQACRHLVRRAVDELGRLDVLVNNAATTKFVDHADLEGLEEADWERLMAVNVRGPFQCARAAREALIAGDGGEIVNVSSVAGIAAIGSSIAYCASKAALNNLTVALARVFAPEVRVNAVAPGFITGRWLKGGLGDAYELAKSAAERGAPLGRVCDPEDVAGAILALLSGPDLITGQLLPIEGGMLMAGRR